MVKKETDDCILKLNKTGFKICAVVADDHSANVNAFSYLRSICDGDKKRCIYDSANNRLFKTYLFFDMVCLLKIIRNTHRSRKKIAFLSFGFVRLRI